MPTDTHTALSLSLSSDPRHLCPLFHSTALHPARTQRTPPALSDRGCALRPHDTALPRKPEQTGHQSPRADRSGGGASPRGHRETTGRRGEGRGGAGRVPRWLAAGASRKDCCLLFDPRSHTDKLELLGSQDATFTYHALGRRVSSSAWLGVGIYGPR